MSHQTMALTAQVKAAVRPLARCRKKSFFLRVTSSVHISGSWDGGSRDEAHLYRAQDWFELDQSKHFVQQTKSNPFNLRVGELQLEAGHAVVITGTFCGKPATPTLVVHPDTCIPGVYEPKREPVPCEAGGGHGHVEEDHDG